MALRIGVGVGPIGVSGSIGRRPTQAEIEQQDQFNLIAVVVIVFCAGPWAAIQALDGRWGVTAVVLGSLFIALSIASAFFLPLGQFIGTSWFMYIAYALGYFSLWEGSGEWIGDLIPSKIDSLDGLALGLLGLLLGLLLLVIIVGIPLIAAWLVATIVTSKGDAVRRASLARWRERRGQRKADSDARPGS